MNRNEIDAVELAEQTIWEGFRLYAQAPGTSIIENKCVRAMCTGVPYQGFNAAFGRGRYGPSGSTTSWISSAMRTRRCCGTSGRRITESSLRYASGVLCSMNRSPRWWLISRSRREARRRSTSTSAVLGISRTSTRGCGSCPGTARDVHPPCCRASRRGRQPNGLPVRAPARSGRRRCRRDGRRIPRNASRRGSAHRDRAQSPEAGHRHRDDGRCTRARPPPRRSLRRTNRVSGWLWHLRAPRLRDRCHGSALPRPSLISSTPFVGAASHRACCSGVPDGLPSSAGP